MLNLPRIRDWMKRSCQSKNQTHVMLPGFHTLHTWCLFWFLTPTYAGHTFVFLIRKILVTPQSKNKSLFEASKQIMVVQKLHQLCWMWKGATAKRNVCARCRFDVLLQLASRAWTSNKWVTLGWRFCSSSREEVRTWKSSCASLEGGGREKTSFNKTLQIIFDLH